MNILKLSINIDIMQYGKKFRFKLINGHKNRDSNRLHY